MYELLQVSDGIRDHIVGKATAREIRDTAIAEGMRTMLLEACTLVADGHTTVEDVLRNVYAPGMDAGEEIDITEMAQLEAALHEPAPAANGHGNGHNGHGLNGQNGLGAVLPAAPRVEVN